MITGIIFSNGLYSQNIEIESSVPSGISVCQDADTFYVEFERFSNDEKAVIFAAALSIDLDFFDNNQANN